MTPARPINRDEYLDSLRDGREVWIHGERVDDVTAHPAFRNSARSVARLYDALHDPAHKDVLTVETDTGNGGFTHPFFRAPTSAEDLVRGRDAIAAWQRHDIRLDGPDAPTTRRPSSPPTGRTPTTTRRTTRTPPAGTARPRSACSS